MSETKIRQTDVLDHHRMSPHYNRGYDMSSAADMSGFVEAGKHVLKAAAVAGGLLVAGNIVVSGLSEPATAETPASHHIDQGAVPAALSPHETLHIQK